MNDDFKVSEQRRQTRKALEKGIAGAEPDRIQMNDLMLAALVIIAAVISFTDFSFTIGSIANITALTIFLYIITNFVFRNRYAKGISRGKKDTDYIDSLEKYREKRAWIYDNKYAGLISGFCTYYKKKELREYRESLLCDIDMSYDEYAEKYLRMPKRKIMRQPISLIAKKTLLKCNAAKSIRLLPGMILNESGEFDRHKLIGKSGRQRERFDKRKAAVTRAVYVVFGAVVAFDVIFNFSLQTILQWVIRMLPVVIAIITGDDAGYCNITVTETAFKRAQVNVINLFGEYLEEEKKIVPQDTEEQAAENK